MSIKPILMNTEMVRAILDGRKSVTRRVCKITVNGGESVDHMECVTHEYPARDYKGPCVYFSDKNGHYCGTAYPPYRPGDILYVRETWAPMFDYKDGKLLTVYAYRASVDEYYKNSSLGTVVPGWHPSIHMPREAARIWLRVTDVRVERLQEINMFGIWNEGVVPVGVKGGHWHQWQNDYMRPAWDSTIKPADRERYGWAANPFCWVISFERISKDEAMQ